MLASGRLGFAACVGSGLGSMLQESLQASSGLGLEA